MIAFMISAFALLISVAALAVSIKKHKDVVHGNVCMMGPPGPQGPKGDTGERGECICQCCMDDGK